MENFNYKKIAQFLKALSHPTRLLIVQELMKNKKCVNDIEDILELRQPNISQHLNLLRLSNVVDFKQDGNKKCYFLKDPKLIKNLFDILKNLKNVSEI
ncbi:MAG: ArsR/SmtB family transcription factor, partial [Candidatus Humimicrobiaceae bacterium]